MSKVKKAPVHLHTQITITRQCTLTISPEKFTEILVAEMLVPRDKVLSFQWPVDRDGEHDSCGGISVSWTEITEEEN